MNDFHWDIKVRYTVVHFDIQLYLCVHRSFKKCIVKKIRIKGSWKCINNPRLKHVDSSSRLCAKLQFVQFCAQSLELSYCILTSILWTPVGVCRGTLVPGVHVWRHDEDKNVAFQHQTTPWTHSPQYTGHACEWILKRWQQRCIWFMLCCVVCISVIEIVRWCLRPRTHRCWTSCPKTSQDVACQTLL